MGGLSPVHLILLAFVALIMFGGRNKISDIMGDVAKGIKSFKKGLSDDETTPVTRPVEPPRTLDHYPTAQQPVSHGEPVSQPSKVG